MWPTTHRQSRGSGGRSQRLTFRLLRFDGTGSLISSSRFSDGLDGVDDSGDLPSPAGVSLSGTSVTGRDASGPAWQTVSGRWVAMPQRR